MSHIVHSVKRKGSPSRFIVFNLLIDPTNILGDIVGTWVESAGRYKRLEFKSLTFVVQVVEDAMSRLNMYDAMDGVDESAKTTKKKKTDDASDGRKLDI